MPANSHRYGWVVVFESWEVQPPKFTSSEVTTIDLTGKVQMKFPDFARENSGSLSDSHVEELGDMSEHPGLQYLTDLLSINFKRQPSQRHQSVLGNLQISASSYALEC